MMNINELEKHIDPFDSSLDYLLIIVFSKSSSKNFSLVLSAANGAKKLLKTNIGGLETYFVCFGKDRIDTERAITILDYVYNWKGIQVFSKGRLLKDLYRVKDVLNCYLNSIICRDYKAHCFTIIDDPFSEIKRGLTLTIPIKINIPTNKNIPQLKKRNEIKRFSFPCTYVFPYTRFQKDHPSKAEDQIQASAVAMCCDWCPNFNADNWQKVGFEEILEDL